MRKTFLAILLFCFGFSLFAADDNKTIMATTDDGRKVVLLPDWTWKWADSAPQKTLSQDEIWQKVIEYLGEQGYSIKMMDNASKTLQTDWFDKIVPRLAPTSGAYKGDRRAFTKNGIAQWAITCILKTGDIKLNFQYRQPEPTHSYEVGGMGTQLGGGFSNFDIKDENFCKRNITSFPVKFNLCEKLKKNEAAIKEDIDALIKPATAPTPEKKGDQK